MRRVPFSPETGVAETLEAMSAHSLAEVRAGWGRQVDGEVREWCAERLEYARSADVLVAQLRRNEALRRTLCSKYGVNAPYEPAWHWCEGSLDRKRKSIATYDMHGPYRRLLMYGVSDDIDDSTVPRYVLGTMERLCEAAGSREGPSLYAGQRIDRLMVDAGWSSADPAVRYTMHHQVVLRHRLVAVMQAAVRGVLQRLRRS